MTVVGEIGACSVCRRTTRLDHSGCAECVARFGARFVELAARVRRDPQFAEAVLEALQEPSHRKLFVEYFGADEDCSPPPVRHPIEE
ncbi:MAG: hypothetical protein IT348_10440 [Candidatus Eisenbacteria bacterium]|nr:hypothetical protein [Candidatus Eisenbacteria bacterium]